ncbi:XRE family transcriptional regulator [Vibrio sp. 10N.239.311.G01]|uniref:XRE family transcriptional regulator n=1 Tax=Vibrio sp. 10N.239.311.G01 TaxID=3229976 RepID=UPI00354B6010
MTNAVIERLIQFRIANGIKQTDLSTAMGFRDRQTLSAIENQERELKPKELQAALKHMCVSMKEFLDPTSLVGKASFSWRQQEATGSTLEATEEMVSKVVGLYEHIQETDSASPLLFKLPLNKQSTPDHARAAAEKLGAHIKLGSYPAKNLMNKLSELGIHALYLDLPQDVSAAAINVTKGNYIALNRNEVFGRLNFNCAHELFHSLTWDALPPSHYEKPYSKQAGKKPIEEKLADAFAEALLMPKVSVMHHVENHTSYIDEKFINELANRFEVSSPAMVHRLHTLKILTQADRAALDEDLLRFNGGSQRREKPKIFSDKFVNDLHNALYRGKVSARKATINLDMSVEDLEAIFESYDLASPLEL